MSGAITRAMILAAGKGERMRPLTANCPKPLLKVNGKALIEYSIEKLKTAGITDLVINVSWLGHLIEAQLGNGSRYGVRIRYSREVEPLETGGGIAKALPLLCAEDDKPFLLVNADVWCDYNLASLKTALAQNHLAHLVLVNNPSHNSKGDFALQGKRVSALVEGKPGFTYSGIAVIAPQLFKRYAPAREKFPLRDLLLQAMQHNEVCGELHAGVWVDVGTPERLEEIQSSS